MVIRFVLRRMAQLGDSSLADEVLDGIDQLYPAFADIITYFKNLHNLEEEYQHIGGRVLDALAKSIVSELDYYRMWGLDLFSRFTRWNHANRFFQMLGEARDQVVRRELILAMGRAHQQHWFQMQWRNLFNEGPWPRRALIAAMAVMKWAKFMPF
jgi:hypothetical protein